jgi:peptidyl-prolyl cis-trans isomerase B (cyclophilin B)
MATQRIRPWTWLLALAAAALAAGACGVEGRVTREARQAREQAERQAVADADAQFEWPGGPRDTAVLQVAGLGTIRIALYPELAPQTVENFTRLAEQGFYDGTTFHRVIPGFMIQGGDPNTKNADPNDDGQGGPGHSIPDEFNQALHLRGAVSMANKGHPNSAGSQFFVVQQGQPGLDGRYAIFGRVVEGMELVDEIARAERDMLGRWGPKDRPLENIVMERVRVERAGAAVGQQEAASAEQAG